MKNTLTQILTIFNLMRKYKEKKLWQFHLVNDMPYNTSMPYAMTNMVNIQNQYAINCFQFMWCNRHKWNATILLLWLLLISFLFSFSFSLFFLSFKFMLLLMSVLFLCTHARTKRLAKECFNRVNRVMMIVLQWYAFVLIAIATDVAAIVFFFSFSL